MSVTVKPDLHERVYRALAMQSMIGNPQEDPLAQVHNELRETCPGEFTMHQLDLIDWGYVCGLAMALARLDDPFSPVEDVAEAAVAAARLAWGEYSHTMPGESPVGSEAAA